MPMKLNISEKEKAWKIELESEILSGKSLGDKIQGSEVSADLAGYELEITGASDKSGFPHKENIEGIGQRRVLLTKGWGMHKRPRKEGKKRVSTPNGLRLKKTVRGKELSEKTIQVNLKIIKTGSKALKEIFPDQNKPKEEPKKEETPAEKSTEQPTQPETPKEKTEAIAKEIKEEIKEEVKKDIPSSPETKTEEQKEEVAKEIAKDETENSNA